MVAADGIAIQQGAPASGPMKTGPCSLHHCKGSTPLGLNGLNGMEALSGQPHVHRPCSKPAGWRRYFSSHHWMTTLAKNPRNPTPRPKNSTKVPNRPALGAQASCRRVETMHRKKAPTP